MSRYIIQTKQTFSKRLDIFNRYLPVNFGGYRLGRSNEAGRGPQQDMSDSIAVLDVKREPTVFDNFV